MKLDNQKLLQSLACFVHEHLYNKKEKGMFNSMDTLKKGATCFSQLKQRLTECLLFTEKVVVF